MIAKNKKPKAYDHDSQDDYYICISTSNVKVPMKSTQDILPTLPPSTRDALQKLSGKAIFRDNWRQFLETQEIFALEGATNSNARFLLVARDKLERAICIDLERALTLERVPGNLQETAFLNSSIEQFLQCMEAHEDYWRKRQKRFGSEWPDTKDGLKLVEALIAKIKENDLSCISMGIWAGILEQLEQDWM